MAISLIIPANLFAKTAREIDASADAAIERFHKQVVGAKKLIESSKGMLVMPNFVFDAKGLIADISLKGAKFTKLNK
jgi:lipid-binding SYLF domain-containing protein